MDPSLRNSCHDKDSRRVRESTLGGSGRALSEGQREHSRRVRESTGLGQRGSMRAQWVLRGSDGLMSPAIPGDGRERSGSGETQARPKATGLMTEIYALVLYLNEKSIKSQRGQNLSRGVYVLNLNMNCQLRVW